MKTNLNETQKPTRQNLEAMIERLKDFNSAITMDKNGREAKELRGTFFLFIYYDINWMNALPDSLSKERDEIIRLMTQLAEIIVGHDFKLSLAVVDHASSIFTRDEGISSKLNAHRIILNAKKEEVYEVMEREEKKRSRWPYLIILYIIFKIIKIMMRNGDF